MNNIYSDDFPSNFLAPKNWHAKSKLLNTYPLIHEASRGNIEAVSELIALGVDINCKGDLGHTPLHEAASNGHFEVVEILLANGANPSPISELNKTPVELAKMEKHLNIFNLIEKYEKSSKVILSLDSIFKNYLDIDAFDEMPISLDSSNQNGDFPIHISTQNHSFQEVFSVISHGADINQITNNDWEMTSLHLAIGIGDFNIMKLLLSNGANFHLRNGFGYSPMDIAMITGNSQLIYYLHEWSSANDNS